MLFIWQINDSARWANLAIGGECPMNKIAVWRGSLLQMQSSIDSSTILCRNLAISRQESLLSVWWMSNGIPLEITRWVARGNGWGVRSSLFGFTRAKTYWQNNEWRWRPFLKMCEENDIWPALRYDRSLLPSRGRLKFVWAPRLERFFGDSIPPVEFLKAEFSALIDRLLV